MLLLLSFAFPAHLFAPLTRPTHPFTPMHTDPLVLSPTCPSTPDLPLQLANGFEHHVRFDHHIWNYIFFFHYLQIKPFDELTGIEQYAPSTTNPLPNAVMLWSIVGKI